MAYLIVLRATELQIAHFGQTPMQLFKTPHPGRVLPASPAASSSAVSSFSGTTSSSGHTATASSAVSM